MIEYIKIHTKVHRTLLGPYHSEILMTRNRNLIVLQQSRQTQSPTRDQRIKSIHSLIS